MDARQDSLVRWARQGRRDLDASVGADAAVVVATGVFERDRVVVAGEAGRVQPLLDEALAAHPDHVVLGTPDAVRGLVGVHARPGPGWMELLPGDDAPAVDTAGVGAVSDAEVAAVLADANPHAWVRAGDASVQEWVGGVETGDGGRVPVAVGALAWSTPDVGFLAGVATRPDHRGRGWSGRVCAVLRDRARAERGSVALLVGAENAVAISVYRRLGFRYRPLWVARRAPW